MTVDEGLIAARDAAATSAPHSAEWWAARTPAELREIIKRGLSGGETFQSAVAEAERRASEEARRLRDKETAEAERLARIEHIIRGVMGAALLAIVLYILI